MLCVCVCVYDVCISGMSRILLSLFPPLSLSLSFSLFYHSLFLSPSRSLSLGTRSVVLWIRMCNAVRTWWLPGRRSRRFWFYYIRIHRSGFSPRLHRRSSEALSRLFSPLSARIIWVIHFRSHPSGNCCNRSKVMAASYTFPHSS